MKKLTIFFCLVLPLIGAGFPKEIPKGYMYVGLKLDQNKMKDAMKKVMLPQIYQQMESQVSMMSKMQMGFDFFNDNSSKIGIDPAGYVEVYFNPSSEKGVIVVPSRKPAAFISSLQKILKGIWTDVKVQNLGRVRKLYTTNPNFKNDPVFYVIRGTKIFIAPDQQSLNLPAGVPLGGELVADLSAQIKSESPIMVLALDAKDFPDLRMMGEQRIVALLNHASDRISLDVYVNYPGQDKPGVVTPSFIERNPLLMLAFDFDAQKLNQLLQMGGRNPMSAMLGNMNLADILGKTAFVTVQDFNALELMQGSASGLDAAIGVQTKNSAPIKMILDGIMMQSQGQAKKGSPRMGPEISKDVVDGYDYYTFAGLPMGNASQGSASSGISLYMAFVDDYALLSSSDAGLKKILANYKAGNQAFKIPVKGNNVFLFANVEGVLKKINVVFPMLSSFSAEAGIALDNFKYLLGEIPEKQTNGFFRATLSLIFNQ